MTDVVTRQVIREAIRADVRGRVDRIINRLELEVAELDEPDRMSEALRTALSQVCDAVAEGLVAQMRENLRTQPDNDRG